MPPGPHCVEKRGLGGVTRRVMEATPTLRMGRRGEAQVRIAVVSGDVGVVEWAPSWHAHYRSPWSSQPQFGRASPPPPYQARPGPSLPEQLLRYFECIVVNGLLQQIFGAWENQLEPTQVRRLVLLVAMPLFLG